MTFPGEMSDKTSCALSYDFYQKNFRVNPLEGGLCGTFAFSRHFSRKNFQFYPLFDGTGAVGAGPASLPGIATSEGES